jgi:RNA polymerase sigma-70 factor, ECF subfamily
VHDTMARALLPQARMAYDGIRPYGDYLFGIARNHVLGQMRKSDPLVPVGGGDEAAESASGSDVDHPGSPSPEPTLEEREVDGLLARFLEQSTPVERRLFELRFRDEQPQDQAARGMGLSRIVLRRIEYKLKRRLLAYLKKNGYLTGVSQSVLGVGLRSVLWSVL